MIMWLESVICIYCVIFLTEGSILGKFIENIDDGEVEQPVQNSTCHPDYGLDVYGFLKKYQYPVETHTVTTEDGYILRLQRIPYGRNGNRETKFGRRPTVLLQHGLASSGVDYINRGPNASLGLLLADAGWDVWLGNNRGTTWSRRHVSLNPDEDKEFWNYSFHECGYYDVPAMIDHITSTAGVNKIFYVGHSQGTSQFFAMAATKPSYNKKIALMSALAPVAHMNHMASPLLVPLAKNIELVQGIVDLLGITHVDRSDVISQFAKKFCCDGSDYQPLCATFLFLLCGFNPDQMDNSFIPVIAYNAPGGMSMKMLSHYGQEIKDGFFRRFDYGMDSNLRRYKVVKPPMYNISAITAPIAMYYSQNDFFAAVEDVERLASELSNVTLKYLVPNKYFSHIDFIWAKDVKTLVNDKLIDHMSKYVDDEIFYNKATSQKSFGILTIAVVFFITLVR